MSIEKKEFLAGTKIRKQKRCGSRKAGKKKKAKNAKRFQAVLREGIG